MSKLLPGLLLILAITIGIYEPANSQDQSPVNIFQKATGDGGFEYFAQNIDYGPYQVQIDFPELENLRPSTAIPFYKVIYPGDPQSLFLLEPKSGTNTSFKSRYQIALGDPEANVDLGYNYWLPFENGKEYMLIQGANGSYTHQGKNAFDFVMEEGTKVCASRSGRVVAVKEDSDLGGPDISFMEHGNRITILHDDGSFADYVHLRYNGSLVKAGDLVRAGQVIGYSGNTGWTTKPHLHFQVYKAIKFGIRTLPVKFLISENVAAHLQELRAYKGHHPR